MEQAVHQDMSEPATASKAPWAVLVVDDDAGVRQSLRLCLEAAGARVLGVATGGAALEALDRGHFDIVFLDLWLGAEAGLDLLPDLLARQPDVGVIVVTAFASIESAVDAIKRGAVDYIPKPFTPDQIRLTANRVLETQRSEAPVGRAPGGAGRKRRARILRVSQPGISAVPANSGARRGIRRGCPAPRRERHGEERAGALDSCEQPASQRAIRHGQLPGALGRSDDERALWSPERRLHRRGGRCRRQGTGG